MPSPTRIRSAALGVLLILLINASNLTPGYARTNSWFIHRMPSASMAFGTPNRSPQTASSVVSLVNQYRAHYGLAPLRLNSQLCTAAQSHSVFMARTGRFDHYGPNGLAPWDEARQVGFSSHAFKENIASGQESPQEVVNDWMNSPHHRANMLSPAVTEVGIGVQNNYWTMMLAD